MPSRGPSSRLSWPSGTFEACDLGRVGKGWERLASAGGGFTNSETGKQSKLSGTRRGIAIGGRDRVREKESWQRRRHERERSPKGWRSLTSCSAVWTRANSARSGVGSISEGGLDWIGLAWAGLNGDGGINSTMEKGNPTQKGTRWTGHSPKTCSKAIDDDDTPELNGEKANNKKRVRTIKFQIQTNG